MFIQVSESAGHSLALTKEGYVYGKGSNNLGQLTNSRFQFEPEYVRITNLTNVMQVVANEQLSMILSVSGDVYYFGQRFNRVNKFPTLLEFDQKIRMIAHGLNHYLFLGVDGSVYGSGLNKSGQLGSIAETIILEKILGLSDIVKISAGNDYSLALNNKGHVYVFGNNNLGQLGIGEYTLVITPVRNLYLNNIVDITAGNNHSLALSTNNGYLYGFGSNDFGQLAIPYESVKYKRFPAVIARDVVNMTVKGDCSMVKDDKGQQFVTGLLNNLPVNHWVKLGKLAKV